MRHLTRISLQPTPRSESCFLPLSALLGLSRNPKADRTRQLGSLYPDDRHVAKQTAALTDTHPLLFHASGGKRLGRRAAAHFEACEQRRSITYVPVAVIWEISLLSRVGRIDLRGSLRDFFDDLFGNPAYQPLDLTPEQVYLADAVQPNNDPFDALICAAARSLSLPLISRDAAIQDSGLVQILWS